MKPPIEVVVADSVHPEDPTVFMYGHHEDNSMTSEEANLLAGALADAARLIERVKAERS